MKGIIVAAGYGSRFLPITKTLPKEMLPLYDKTLLDCVLDEFEEAGIRDILIITSRRKKVLEDYLDREVELEEVFTREGKIQQREIIRPRNLNISFVRQQEMKGTGQALLLAQPWIKDEPFIVAYPDDIVLHTPGISTQLIAAYKHTPAHYLVVREELHNISRYGVIDGKQQGETLIVSRIVEKPTREEAPSHWVSIGRYLFEPEIFALLESGWKKHTTGEFYHIDAINTLAKEGKMRALPLKGMMLDTGEPESYLYSLLLYCKQHPKASKVLSRFLAENP
ncbi:MAG: UTP--glucose-1-phosphate uridylyltransferase [Brevinematales bacterium]|nr:UTP--glucose-1-phosphate uridylyltransferase [Brevinematales bacterium]